MAVMSVFLVNITSCMPEREFFLLLSGSFFVLEVGSMGSMTFHLGSMKQVFMRTMVQIPQRRDRL